MGPKRGEPAHEKSRTSRPRSPLLTAADVSTSLGMTLSSTTTSATITCLASGNAHNKACTRASKRGNETKLACVKIATRYKYTEHHNRLMHAPSLCANARVAHSMIRTYVRHTRVHTDELHIATSDLAATVVPWPAPGAIHLVTLQSSPFPRRSGCPVQHRCWCRVARKLTSQRVARCGLLDCRSQRKSRRPACSHNFVALALVPHCSDAWSAFYYPTPTPKRTLCFLTEWFYHWNGGGKHCHMTVIQSNFKRFLPKTWVYVP